MPSHKQVLRTCVARGLGAGGRAGAWSRSKLSSFSRGLPLGGEGSLGGASLHTRLTISAGSSSSTYSCSPLLTEECGTRTPYPPPPPPHVVWIALGGMLSWLDLYSLITHLPTTFRPC